LVVTSTISVDLGGEDVVPAGPVGDGAIDLLSPTPNNAECLK
jgi:hypothetical protein